MNTVIDSTATTSADISRDETPDTLDISEMDTGTSTPLLTAREAEFKRRAAESSARKKEYNEKHSSLDKKKVCEVE